MTLMFTILTAILAVAYISIPHLRGVRVRESPFRKSLALFITAVVLYFPAAELYEVGPKISLVTTPVGFILLILAFRFLVVELSRPQEHGSRPPRQRPMNRPQNRGNDQRRGSEQRRNPAPRRSEP